MDIWQWVDFTSKTHILQGYANFSTPNNSCLVQYHWANPTLYTNGRNYFGQVESGIPAPREKIGQSFSNIDTVYTIDVYGTHNDTIEYAQGIVPSQTIQLDSTTWRIVFTNHYSLPKFSYIPTQTPSSEGLTCVIDSKCRLTLPTMLNESSDIILRIIGDLFDLIHQRTTLLPPRGYLDVLYLPSMRFCEIWNEAPGDTNPPQAFYASSYIQVFFRADDIFSVIADNDWAKKLLIHEFIHAFMHDYLVNGLPKLLVEGFAKYFEWRLFAEWGYQSEYQQHIRACQQRVESFRASHNGSLQSIWSWNNTDISYKVAHYVVALLANASKPQMYTRFFALGRVSTWYVSLRLVSRLFPEAYGWGLIAYTLGLAAEKPLSSIFLSLDCPLIWHPIVITVGFLFLWGCVGGYCLLVFVWNRSQPCRRWRRKWIFLGVVQILLVLGFSVLSLIITLGLVSLMLIASHYV